MKHVAKNLLRKYKFRKTFTQKKNVEHRKMLVIHSSSIDISFNANYYKSIPCFYRHLIGKRCKNSMTQYRPCVQQSRMHSINNDITWFPFEFFTKKKSNIDNCTCNSFSCFILANDTTIRK